MRAFSDLVKEWEKDPEYLSKKEEFDKIYAEEFRLCREMIEAKLRFEKEHEKNQRLYGCDLAATEDVVSDVEPNEVKLNVR